VTRLLYLPLSFIEKRFEYLEEEITESYCQQLEIQRLFIEEQREAIRELKQEIISLSSQNYTTETKKYYNSNQHHPVSKSYNVYDGKF